MNKMLAIFVQIHLKRVPQLAEETRARLGAPGEARAWQVPTAHAFSLDLPALRDLRYQHETLWSAHLALTRLRRRPD